jgi:hypothetical protein
MLTFLSQIARVVMLRKGRFETCPYGFSMEAKRTFRERWRKTVKWG